MVERGGRVGRPALGVLPLTSVLVASVLVLIGFDADAWERAGLGWLGVACLTGAVVAARSLRCVFPDQVAGRRSLALRLGDAPTRLVYAGLVAAAYAVLGGLALTAPWAAVALVTALPLAIPVWRVRSGAVSGQLDPVVRDTALITLNYGALVGLALALS